MQSWAQLLRARTDIAGSMRNRGMQILTFSIKDPLLALRTVVSAAGLRRQLLAFLLFNTAEWGIWVGALVYAYDLGGTSAAAAVSLLQLLPAAVISPFAASIADRLPRRRVLAWTYAAQSAAMGLTVLLFWLQSSPVLILGSLVLVSVSISLSRPVYLASLPAFATRPSELTAVNSVSTMVESLAVLLGPAIAAAIMQFSGPSVVFAVFGLGQLIAALLVWMPRGAPVGLSAMAVRAPLRPSDWVAAFAEMRVRPDGLLLLGYLAGAYLLVGMADVLAVVLAFEILSLDDSGPGMLISAMGLGGMIGAAASILLAGRRTLGPPLAGALLVAGVPYALAGQANHLLPAVLLLIVAGSGKSFLEVAARTLLQRSVDDYLLARVFGLQEGLMLLALAVGALLVPVLVGVLGARGAFTTAGLMLPALGILTWRRLHAIDADAPLPARSLVLLRRVPMFSHLPAPLLEQVARRMLPVDLVTGDVAIRQGERGEHFYTVESGRLEVSVDDRPRPTLGPGDSFGEIALMLDRPRTATVIAASDVRLWSLDRETFLSAITGSPRAGAVAARVADSRLSATGT
jgi:MFS family permease